MNGDTSGEPSVGELAQARLSRRGLLRFAALGLTLSGGAALLAACGQAATTATTATVTQTVTKASVSTATVASTVVHTATVTSTKVTTVTEAASKSPPSAPITITYESNEVLGGKNAAGAEHVVDVVIPEFEKLQKAKGLNVTVKFVGSGVSGEDYANALALDLKSGGGPDVFDLDGPYYGEFAVSGYLKPLSQVVSTADSWDGWTQIPKSVQAITTFKGHRYGIPTGTDGRVLYYNKKLFGQAGLSVPWQPKNWADIISAGQQLKARIPGIEALQIDGGDSMGEATTLQGFLPLLAGAGQLIYDQSTGKWQGDTPAMRAVANFYHTIYSTGLGNSALQLGPKARDQTFQLFSQGKVGIYLESTYMWESVIAPTHTALYPMSNRNTEVGYTLIPAEAPGEGINGQSFVSMSGGGGQTINPHTKHSQTAWDFLTFMNSKAMLLMLEELKPGLSPRTDVNKVALASHPLLRFVADHVLPITAYRPSLAVYPQVSVAIQKLAQDLATGVSASKALATYTSRLAAAVGASNVTNS